MEQALEKLFESVPKIKLLKLFLMNPDQEFSLAEITKHTQLKSSAAKKELARLIKISLVKSKIITVPEAKKTGAKKSKKKAISKKSLTKAGSRKNKKVSKKSKAVLRKTKKRK